MATTVSEFVGKVMSDKKYMLEVFKNIPDEMLQEDQSKGNASEGNAPEGEQADSEPLGDMMGRYLRGASLAMGFDLDEDELKAECTRQIGELKGFAKVRFAVRFLRTLVKAGKGKKK